MSDEVAVLVETLASTKALRQVELEGKSILIIGSGPIGLLSVVHARDRGARHVAVTGYPQQAQLLSNSIDMFYERELPERALGHGFDVVLDAGGNETSLGFCVQAAKPRGTVLESACMIDEFKVDLVALMKKELRLLTQYGYVPDDFEWAIPMAQRNHAALSRVVTHRFRLDQYAQALTVIEREKHGKIVFYCR